VEKKMLDGLFKPGSVAVVGASNNPFSIGNIVIRNLAAHGFKGPIYPINPNY
jgi:acetyltransferase